MRYLLIHTDDPSLAPGWDAEARASANAWIEEVIRSGVGLQGSERVVEDRGRGHVPIIAACRAPADHRVVQATGVAGIRTPAS